MWMSLPIICMPPPLYHMKLHIHHPYEYLLEELKTQEKYQQQEHKYQHQSFYSKFSGGLREAYIQSSRKKIFILHCCNPQDGTKYAFYY